MNTLEMLKVLSFGREEISATARIVKKYADQKLTLADGHGLVIMHERRIANCWSTNRHLGLGGAILAV